MTSTPPVQPEPGERTTPPPPAFASTTPADHKIAVIGDTHADINFLDWQLFHAAAEGIDTAIQLGDFGWWPPAKYEYGLPEEESYMTAAARTAHHHNICLAFIDGNHEHHLDLRRTVETARLRCGIRDTTDPVWISGDTFDQPHQMGFWYLPRSCRWSWTNSAGGTTVFVAIGGAYSIDSDLRTEGVSVFKTLESPSDEELRIASQGGPADVMLTHDHPHFGYHLASPFSGLAHRHVAASQNVRDRLRGTADAVNPGLVVHGHWHLDYERQVTYQPDGGNKRCSTVAGLGDNRSSKTLNWIDFSETSPTFRRSEPLPPLHKHRNRSAETNNTTQDDLDG